MPAKAFGWIVVSHAVQLCTASTAVPGTAVPPVVSPIHLYSPSFLANANKVWHTHKQDAADNNQRGTKRSRRQRKLVGRWLTIALGVTVGLTGCFVTFFTEWIVHAKLHFVAHIIEEYEGRSGGCWNSPFVPSLQYTQHVFRTWICMGGLKSKIFC